MLYKNDICNLILFEKTTIYLCFDIIKSQITLTKRKFEIWVFYYRAK